MTFLLRTRPATTPAMLAIFDDRETLRLGLAFEAALAEAQASAGLLPAAVTARIAAGCAAIIIDPAELADEAAHAGTLAIPLVTRLRAVLGDDLEAARAVHRGATSQDLSDTVLMCQVRDALAVLADDLRRTSEALADMSERRARTPALGRTLMQDAAPISFGLRTAQWLRGIDEAARRLKREASAAVRVQLGGAVGTRASLGGRGTEIAGHLARSLGLAEPTGPWHAARGGVAGLAAAVGIVIGALGKMARDIAILSQNAIGEAREPMQAGRGGSSIMSGKRNPTGSQVALSAAIRAPGLVASILSGMPQEAERGLGGWQAEAAPLIELFMLAGGAAAAMAVVAEGLEIDEEAIARNLAPADVGSDIGDAAGIVAAIVAAYRETC